MPNQRKEGKKRVGVWLTDDERARLKKAAADQGFDNLADFFRQVIRDAKDPTVKEPEQKNLD